MWGHWKDRVQKHHGECVPKVSRSPQGGYSRAFENTVAHPALSVASLSIIVGHLGKKIRKMEAPKIDNASVFIPTCCLLLFC